MKWYLLSIFWLLFAIPSWGNPDVTTKFPQPIPVDVATNELAISAYCGYLIEGEQSPLKVEELHRQDRTSFLSFDKGFYHRGYFSDKHPIWFTFKIQNTSDRPLSYFFEIPYPNIDQLQLFEVKEGAIHTRAKMGTNLPFQQREVLYRNFIYELTIAPKQTYTYYLYVEKDYDELFLPFKLISPKTHVYSSTRLLLFDGLFYGFLGTIMLVAIAVAVWLKDRVYITYAFLMIFTILFHLADNGLGFELFWGDSPWFQVRARSLASFVSQSAFLLFIIYFFEMNLKRYPILLPLAWTSIGVYALLTVQTLFLKDAAILPRNDFFVQVFIINLFALIGLGLGIIIKGVVLKHRNATWFLWAFLFPVLGCFVLALRNADVLPSNFLVDNFIKFGHFFMFIIFSVVMIKRIRNINEERIDLLGKQADHQKDLIAASLVAMDKERKRIANDLHDGLGALLVSVKHHFASVAKLFEGDNEEEYQKIQQMLEQTYMKTRKITHSMKPPQLEKFGLVPVLEDYCSLIHTEQLTVHLWINGLENNRLSYSEEHNIFRIIQELATNTIKYAEASELVINVSREGNMVSVTVEDDGVGFDKDAPDFKEGLGTRNIQQRVNTLRGTLDIHSSIGEGTSVFIEFTSSGASIQDNNTAYVESEN